LADPHQQPDPQSQRDQTILIAHVRAHLLTGETFELYPFVHDKDVKTEVENLINGWAKDGFLLRGGRMYPWHQVRLLEATSVEEITRGEAERRLMTWQAEDQARQVQSFWKTKQPSEKKDDKDEKDDKGKGGEGGGGEG
jgi:hypothetical protein